MAERRARRALPKGPTTHDVQATVEGVPLDPEMVKTVNGQKVPSGEAVQFLGVWYRIRDRVGLMPLLKFAYFADKGLDSADPAGMAAMYAMLRDCIEPEDWSPFEYAAMDGFADDEVLLGVVRDATEKIAARPTRPPSGSSAGRQLTSGSSKGSSSSPDMIPVAGLLGPSTG